MVLVLSLLLNVLLVLARPTNQPLISLTRKDLSKYGYREIVFEKRSGDTKGFELTNYKSLYYLVPVNIGSPKQTVNVMLDTGSSDVYIQSVDNQNCLATAGSTAALKKEQEAKKTSGKKSKRAYTVVDREYVKRKHIIDERDVHLVKRKNLGVVDKAGDNSQSKAIGNVGLAQTDCFKQGFFAQDLSSTYKPNTTTFTVQYGDGQSAKGNYAQEVATIGDMDFNNFNFGLISSGDTALGVFGIGDKQLQANVAMNHAQPYQSFPYQVQTQFKLKKPAYSIHLSSGDNSTGSILFGAIDKSKYTGDLATFKYQNYKNQAGFYGQLDAIEMYFEGKKTTTTAQKGPTGTKATLKFIKDSVKYTGLFDTGSTLLYFPSEVYNLVGQYVPRAVASENGYQMDCSLMENENNFFRYKFGSKYIDVPFGKANLTSKATGNTCILGISKSSFDDSVTFGDPFFRSSYVVFDLEAKQISVGQTNENPGASEIYIIN